MYAGAARFALGDALADVANDGGGIYAQDAQLAQLHQLALLMNQLRAEFNAQLNAAANADAVFDPNVLTGLAQLLQQYAAQFKTLRATIDATTVNRNALSAADQALLDVGTWAQQTLAILPAAIGEDCVMAKARYYAYEWAEGSKGDMPRNVGSDFKFLMGASDAEFKSLWKQYRRQDRETVDSWYEIRRNRSWLANIDGYYSSIGQIASAGAPW